MDLHVVVAEELVAEDRDPRGLAAQKIGVRFEQIDHAELREMVHRLHLLRHAELSAAAHHEEAHSNDAARPKTSGFRSSSVIATQPDLLKPTSKRPPRSLSDTSSPRTARPP